MFNVNRKNLVIYIKKLNLFNQTIFLSKNTLFKKTYLFYFSKNKVGYIT